MKIAETILLCAATMALGSSIASGQIGSKVNLQMPEGAKIISASMSGNGNGIIISAATDNKIRIYEADCVDGNYGELIENDTLNALIDSGGDITSPVYAAGTDKIYFSARISDNADIYTIEKRNGIWQSPVNSGDSINTSADELSPAVSYDGKTLYFCRRNTQSTIKNSDCSVLFMSNLNADGFWTSAIKIPEPINSGCETAPYPAADNSSLYISSQREGGKGGFDIYYVKRSGQNIWMLPRAVDTLNTPDDEFACFFNIETKNLNYLCSGSKKSQLSGLYKTSINSEVTPDMLYEFSGHITDAKTGRDIQADINISNPINSQTTEMIKGGGPSGYKFYLTERSAGLIDFSAPGYSHCYVQFSGDTIKPINKLDVMLFSESTVKINAFDKEMFEPVDVKFVIEADGINFNSFKTIKNADGRYSISLPLGKEYKITVKNSLYADYPLWLNLKGNIQFDEVEFDAELESMKQEVKIQVNGADVPAEIEIVNLNTQERFTLNTVTDQSGKATVYLRKGDKYEINISQKGYTYFNTTLSLDKMNNTTPSITATIEKLKQDSKIELKNITFETNSAEINSQSEYELNRLLNLMTENPLIKIELSAHTDDKGSDAYNMKLSLRRAEAIVNWLSNYGIDRSRLISKGYGKSKPLVPNTNDENRSVNRRVELKVTELVKE